MHLKRAGTTRDLHPVHACCVSCHSDRPRLTLTATSPCVCLSLQGKPPFYTKSIYTLVNHIVKDPVKYPPDMSDGFKVCV